MTDNILELIYGISQKINPGLKTDLDKLKKELSPIVLEEPEEKEPLVEGSFAGFVEGTEVIKNEKRVSFHVTYVKEGKCWKISLAGEDKAISLKKTKKLAIEKAKKLAKGFIKSQIIIHKKNGQFQEERTYNEDPRISKG